MVWSVTKQHLFRTLLFWPWSQKLEGEASERFYVGETKENLLTYVKFYMIGSDKKWESTVTSVSILHLC